MKGARKSDSTKSRDAIGVVHATKNDLDLIKAFHHLCCSCMKFGTISLTIPKLYKLAMEKISYITVAINSLKLQH